MLKPSWQCNFFQSTPEEKSSGKQLFINKCVKTFAINQNRKRYAFHQKMSVCVYHLSHHFQ
jgi:hypothetical protein